jgi:hypothetical protein
MRHDAEGRLVEIGARTRTIPPALRRALLHRDRSCRFPGCHVRVGQGHHVRHWAQGGPTTLANLALLCRRHHRTVHDEGYQLERLADGALRFRRPDGRPLPEVPRRRRCLPIRLGACGRSTTRKGCGCMRGRRARSGWGSAWTWAGRSACCIRWLRDTYVLVPPSTNQTRPLAEARWREEVAATGP